MRSLCTCVHSTFSLSPHPLMDACIFVIERTGGQGCCVCVCVCVHTMLALSIHTLMMRMYLLLIGQEDKVALCVCTHSLSVHPLKTSQMEEMRGARHSERMRSSALSPSRPATPHSPSVSVWPPILDAWWELWRSTPLVSFKYATQEYELWPLCCTLNPQELFYTFWSPSPILPTAPTPTSSSLFSVSMSYVFKISHISETVHCLSFSVWLTSLDVTPSKSAAKDSTSFFL